MQAIFISYSRNNARNEQFAKNLKEFLDRKGVNAFLDEKSLTIGQNWLTEIRKNIESSLANVLVLSKEVKKSPYIQLEFDLIKESGKPYFPVVVDGSKISDFSIAADVQTRFTKNEVQDDTIFEEILNETKAIILSQEKRRATNSEVASWVKTFRELLKNNNENADYVALLLDSIKIIEEKRKAFRLTGNNAFIEFTNEFMVCGYDDVKNTHRFWCIHKYVEGSNKEHWFGYDSEQRDFVSIKQLAAEARMDTKKRFVDELAFYEKNQHNKLLDLLKVHKIHYTPKGSNENDEEYYARVIEESGEYWIALEFVRRGNLLYHLIDRGKRSSELMLYEEVNRNLLFKPDENLVNDLKDIDRKEDWAKVKVIFRNIAIAIKKLHEAGYIYRNVNPENILIYNASLDIKLCDFDRIVEVGSQPEAHQMINDRSIFAAPERFKNPVPDDDPTRYSTHHRIGSFKSDSYSLSVILLGVFDNFSYGIHIYDNYPEIRNEILTKRIPKKVPKNVYPLRTALRKGLDKNIERRLSLDDFKSDLEKIKWQNEFQAFWGLNKRYTLLMLALFLSALVFVVWISGHADKFIYDDIINQSYIDGQQNDSIKLTRGRFLLDKSVFIPPGKCLIVEQGAKIEGNSSDAILVISRGASIQAIGSADYPIIFSRRNDLLGAVSRGNGLMGTIYRFFARSDSDDNRFKYWGGLAICGYGKIIDESCDHKKEKHLEFIPRKDQAKAMYGGENKDGKEPCNRLSFTRIEYGGGYDWEYDETSSNGLTLAGLTNKDTLDHIYVKNSRDDAFEFFGGNCIAKYLISSNPIDDAYDFEEGFCGVLQFFIMVANSTRFSENVSVGDNNGIELADLYKEDTIQKPAIFNGAFWINTDSLMEPIEFACNCDTPKYIGNIIYKGYNDKNQQINTFHYSPGVNEMKLFSFLNVVPDNPYLLFETGNLEDKTILDMRTKKIGEGTVATCPYFALDPTATYLGAGRPADVENTKSWCLNSNWANLKKIAKEVFNGE